MSKWIRERTQVFRGYVIAVIIIIATWTLLSWVLQNPALPMPWAAIEQFLAIAPQLLPDVLISLWRVIAAMLVGTLCGLVLGLIIGRSARIDSIAAPLLYLLYPLPKVVFLPILMVFLGIGDAPKIVLITTVIFFQTIVTARGAAKAIASDCITSMRSLGASRLQIAWHVVLPASAPAIFTAARINIGTAIAVLFLTESIAGSTGVGYFIMNAWYRVDYLTMFAGIIAMASMGVVLYEILTLIEKRMIPWVSANDTPASMQGEIDG